MRADGHAALQASSRDQRFWVLYFLIYKCSLIKKKSRESLSWQTKAKLIVAVAKSVREKQKELYWLCFQARVSEFVSFCFEYMVRLHCFMVLRETFLKVIWLLPLCVSWLLIWLFLLLLCSSGTPWCKSREGKSSATLSVWRILREYLRCAQIMIVNKLI